MVRIEWRLHFRSPRTHGKRFMPKRPVNWKGEMWMKYRDGDRVVTDSREWRTHSPILKDDAVDVLRLQLADIIAESGDDAFDAGFWLEVV
ncbi:hypothetical protein D3C78_1001040 [compost metagenome]